MTASYHKHEFIEVICYPRTGPDLCFELKVEEARRLHIELRDALIEAGDIIGLKSTDEERIGG
jgi:hypothetical protein